MGWCQLECVDERPDDRSRYGDCFEECGVGASETDCKREVLEVGWAHFRKRVYSRPRYVLVLTFPRKQCCGCGDGRFVGRS